MKTFSFVLCAFLLIAGVTACSNDIDGNSGEKEVQWSTDDDVLVEFSLLNNEGENTTVFSKNENMIFDLCIVNRSDKDLVYYDFFNDKSDLVVDGDFFCIYTKTGKKIGTPLEHMLAEAVYLLNGRHIPAGTTSHIRCSTYDIYDANGQKWDILPLYYSVDRNYIFPTLDKGDYYTSFVVKYKNNPRNEKLISKKFKVNFKVQ